MYATARRPETLAELEAKGCKTLALDVTDEASRRAAVEAVVAAEGAVGVLINNAGYSQSGAVESVADERVRAQFETNVFGLLAICRLVLPGMREQGWGKIVNVSSMGGRFTFPGGGLYHASKHAIEALSDALRFEVKGFGVDVIIDRAGDHQDQLRRHGGARDRRCYSGSRPYAEFNHAVAEATAGVYESGLLARLGGPPEAVAEQDRAARSPPGGRAPATRSRRRPGAAGEATPCCPTPAGTRCCAASSRSRQALTT